VRSASASASSFVAAALLALAGAAGAMNRLVLLVVLAALCGCETTVSKQSFVAVPEGQRITLISPVTVYETRGPLALKLEWNLLPGDYVERYRIPQGRMFESDGPLVQFHPSTGGTTRSVGGFVLLQAKPGLCTLYVVRKGQTPPYFTPLSTSIAQVLTGPAGDISLVTEFPSSSLKATGW
jgi:hypothetical protein